MLQHVCGMSFNDSQCFSVVILNLKNQLALLELTHLHSNCEPLQIPEYFAEDLFSLLGEERRPDYRWLIMVDVFLIPISSNLMPPCIRYILKMLVT